MILQEERPLLMLGAAAFPPRSTSDLAQFVLRARIQFPRRITRTEPSSRDVLAVSEVN
jgi:hypothetical protein